MIELYKDGDRTAVLTDNENELVFLAEFSRMLSEMIEKGCYDGDWEFPLINWLPQMVDICCKYRGYKASVTERRVIIAGDNMIAHAEPAHAFKFNRELMNELEKTLRGEE